MKHSQTSTKRKTVSVPRLRESDFEETTQSEIRQKHRRGPASKAFAERSAKILKKLQNVADQPVFVGGDNRDTFFQNTLRNWGDLKIPPRTFSLNPTISADSFKSEKLVSSSARTTTTSGYRSASVYSSRAAGDRKSREKFKQGRRKSFDLSYQASLPELLHSARRKQNVVGFKKVPSKAEKSATTPSEWEVEEEEEDTEKERLEEQEEVDFFFSPSSDSRREEEEEEEFALGVTRENQEEKEEEEEDEEFQLTDRTAKEDLEEKEEELYLTVDEEQEEEDNESDLETPRNEQIKEEEESEEDDYEAETELNMAEDAAEDDMTLDETVTEDLQTEELDDQDLQEIENLVKQADKELDEVIDESLRDNIDQDVTDLLADQPELKNQMDSGAGGGGGGGGTGGGSYFQYDPTIDAAVLVELEDAEKQAMDTAKIIYELKQRVGELLCKSKMTAAEGKELEQKNHLLKEQMCLFEEKTKRIQQLITQTNLFEKMNPLKPSANQKRPEDMLPKVVICGLTENNMPKIIVCDDKDKKRRSSRKPCIPDSPTGMAPKFAQKLNESYCMQERLANDNVQLEGKRYQLQEDLLSRDQAVENLQRKLCSLEQELRLVCKENQKLKGQPGGDKGDRSDNNSPCGKKMACGKGKGPCPAEMENRLMEYVETTQNLEKQLSVMENEVRHMQCELVEVQKERQHLEHHRRMICTPKPCPPPCCPPPCGPPARPPCGTIEQQLSQLKEQYCRLQDDFKSKLTEVASLRAENEKLKKTDGGDDMRRGSENRVKDLEREVRVLKIELEKAESQKQQMVELESQLTVAKQRFRDAQDELEELRALIQDQQTQMDDYRNKYLQAQQTVEEQRRQIDLMEIENNRISEQVNLEIQRVKNQFQEKLQELTPLPDILKATQIKLQEAQQMHLLAERNNEAIARELQQYKDRAAALANDMEKVRSDQQLGADEHAVMGNRIKDLTRKCDELEEENDKLKMDMVRLEEAYDQAEKRVQEKLHEITQLVAQLDSVREESARQVARTKDRCETVRRSMQNQIADMERQLAQSRAQARQAQKDRDEIRQKMQAQITNLNENFEDAQMRIKNLQAHVNFLKNTYSSVYPEGGTSPFVGDGGLDACDCGQY